jgi:hypothetical protein
MSEYVAAAIGLRARMSKSQPGLTTGTSDCKAARIKRFARFLCTAFPTDRPADTANRD